MDSVIPCWDYVIGDKSEALAFSESHNLGVRCPPQSADETSMLVCPHGPPTSPRSQKRLLLFRRTLPDPA
ncbi:hypothetical protein BDZ91DRAFT_709406 [Kalaharituber pfeilii]|nr:hypothetical protein BDZ91DRAFT_709406 [Kalaharituber pfeilii]